VSFRPPSNRRAVAFNNVGDFWLAPGASTTMSLKFGQSDGEPEWGGHDQGAQWIMADPIGTNPAVLLVKDHTKEHKPRAEADGGPVRRGCAKYE
jgi:hypothetical protein